jgi:UDP-glucose 4-epimerase
VSAAVSVRGQRVLVTGGAGTIGSTLCDQLAEAQADVVALDNLVRGSTANLEQSLAAGRVQLVQGDVRDRALVRTLAEGADVVFHLAALRITQCAQEPELAIDSLIGGTYSVFEAARDAGVRKVVYSSSASVYGMAETFPTSEAHHPYNNDTLYGGAKLFGEQLLSSFHSLHGLAGVSLRYFNVYGPRMDIHGRYTEVLVRWMQRIAAGEAPVIFGDGQQTLDMVFTEDVARANILAAEADVEAGIYNVGSGTEISLRELAKCLAEVMGRPDLGPAFAPARAVNPVHRRLADVGRARADLGFETRVNLRDGLSQLVAWWRGQPQLQAEA